MVLAEASEVVVGKLSIGDILTAASFLVFVTIYVVNSRGAAKVLATRLTTVDTTITEVKDELKKLSDIVIEQTRQSGRIDMIEQRIMQEGQRIDDFGRNLGDFKNLVIRDHMVAPRAKTG